MDGQKELINSLNPKDNKSIIIPMDMFIEWDTKNGEKMLVIPNKDMEVYHPIALTKGKIQKLDHNGSHLRFNGITRKNTFFGLLKKLLKKGYVLKYKNDELQLRFGNWSGLDKTFSFKGMEAV